MSIKQDLVLAHLKSGKSIRSTEAIEKWGNTRLAASIHSLKKEGHLIKTVMKKGIDRYGTATHFAEYSLNKLEVL